MNKTILGIDPGFSFTGFCVIRSCNNKTYLIESNYLALSSQKTLSERVGIFFKQFDEKIKIHGVTHIALETSFLSKNPQTFLKLG